MLILFFLISMMRGCLCHSCGASTAALPDLDESFFSADNNNKGFRTLLLRNVCMRGSSFILHSSEDYYDNKDRLRLPSFDTSSLPNTYDVGFINHTDHPLNPYKKETCKYSDVSFRFPTPLEAKATRSSDFTNCTLPVVIFSNWPHNYGENFGNMVSGLHLLVSQKKVMNRHVTLLQASPCNIPLQDHHLKLLQPFSDRAVNSWDAFTRETLVDPPGPEPQLCFSRLALLVILGMKVDTVYQGAQQIVEYYKSRHLIPRSEVFKRSSDAKVLKILFLNRPPSSMATGTSINASDHNLQPYSFTEDHPMLDWMRKRKLRFPPQFKGRPIYPSIRQILNQEAILKTCNTYKWSSVLGSNSRWKEAECQSYVTHSLLLDIAVMLEADVLISLHSSGEMNGLFMRPNTQKIQLRQKEFGTKHRYFSRYWTHLCEKSNFPFQCFFINFEEDASWEPGIHERLGYPSMSDTATRRDRHLWLDFDPLVHVLKEVLTVQGHRGEYLRRWKRCHVAYNVWWKGNVTYGSHRAIDSTKIGRGNETVVSDGFNSTTHQCDED
jgi:hypothetical protein